MKTRCKFTCRKVEKSVSWRDKTRFLYTAVFEIVSDGSDENRQFFEATPSGELSIGTYMEDRFTPGTDYYIDIEEA